MVFREFKRVECVLYFDPPLVLKPSLDDETRQLLLVTNEDLGIYVYAQTREQLADELAAEVFFLWDEYAQESPDKLTDKAKELRTKLLNRCREEAHDAA